MPHRPASSDGQSSVFVSLNPIGRRYHLPKIARRYARLGLAIGGLGSAAAEGRCGIDSIESPHLNRNGSGYRNQRVARLGCSIQNLAKTRRLSGVMRGSPGWRFPFYPLALAAAVVPRSA